MAKNKNLLWGGIAVVAVGAIIIGLSSGGPKESADVCNKVRIANPGWSDLNISIGWIRNIFEPIGYEVTETQVSTTVTFASLKNADLDIMLADWRPSDDDLAKEYDGHFVELGRNYKKVDYTLATTPTAYEAGLKTWQDIPKFKDQLKGKIYGIEPGSAGNNHVQRFLEDMGVAGDFRLIEAATTAMLAEVEKNVDGFIVYLAWEPHWMVKYEPQYLDGGEEWLGQTAHVNTLGRAGYDKECPNVSKFFANFVQDPIEVSKLIDRVDLQGEDAIEVSAEWLRNNPDVLKAWTKGFKTADGSQDAYDVVADALGM